MVCSTVYISCWANHVYCYQKLSEHQNHHGLLFKSSSDVITKNTMVCCIKHSLWMLSVDKCSRPWCFHKFNFSLKMIKNPNNVKVHNTYYNNMVCYINNKQSDTDSHQSKVNNNNDNNINCKQSNTVNNHNSEWKLASDVNSNYCITLPTIEFSIWAAQICRQYLNWLNWKTN